MTNCCCHSIYKQRNLIKPLLYVCAVVTSLAFSSISFSFLVLTSYLPACSLWHRHLLVFSSPASSCEDLSLAHLSSAQPSSTNWSKLFESGYWWNTLMFMFSISFKRAYLVSAKARQCRMKCSVISISSWHRRHLGLISFWVKATLLPWRM